MTAKQYSDIMRFIGQIEGLTINLETECEVGDVIEKLIKIIDEIEIRGR